MVCGGVGMVHRGAGMVCGGVWMVCRGVGWNLGIHLT